MVLTGKVVLKEVKEYKAKDGTDKVLHQVYLAAGDVTKGAMPVLVSAEEYAIAKEQAEVSFIPSFNTRTSPYGGGIELSCRSMGDFKVVGK